MKKLVLVLMLVLVSVSVSAMSLDKEYFKDGETGTSGFGPRASTGNYGEDSDSTAAEECKMVWEIGCNSGEESAEFVLESGGYYANAIDIRHLDGIADDSFELWVWDGSKWDLVGSYDNGDPVVDPETWKTTTFPITDSMYNGGSVKFKIVATGDAWDQCGTYGQLALHYAELYGGTEIPEFGFFAGVITITAAVGGLFVFRRKD